MTSCYDPFMPTEKPLEPKGFVLALAQVAVYVLSFLGVVIFAVIFRAFVTGGVSWYWSAGCFAVGLLILLMVTNLRKAIANRNSKRATWFLVLSAVIFLSPALYVIGGVAHLMFSDERKAREREAIMKQYQSATPLFESCRYAFTPTDWFTIKRKTDGGYIKGKAFMMNGENPPSMVEAFFSLPNEIRASRPDEISSIILLYGDTLNPKRFSDGSLGIRVRIIDRTLSTDVLDDVVEEPPPKAFADENEQATYIKQNENKLIAYLSNLPRR